MTLQFDILTLFPKLFDSPFSEGLLHRAQAQDLIRILTHDIRDYTDDKHRTADDVPYGGGPGMVLKAAPVVKAIEAAQQPGKKSRRIYFSPQGRRLEQRDLAGYLKYEQLVLLCGHYEGVDERALEAAIDEEVSVGDYVLTGGEYAAVVFVDAIARLVPGVVGDAQSLEDESFSGGLLEYPHYTRPQNFRGRSVPEVLLTGNHSKIEQWRRQQALERTRRRRPDLLPED